MTDKRVFLGGTCNGSDWRDRLIPLLRIGYYNPVVEDWTPECQAEEVRQRETCDFVLYCITPRMTGVYSIAEAVDDSNKRPERTVFCVLGRDVVTPGYDTTQVFTEGQVRSLRAVAAMVERNGGKAFESLDDCAVWLNKAGQSTERR